MAAARVPGSRNAEHLEVRVGAVLIRYEVVRSARRKKTIEITLDPKSGVRVAAPMKASDARIEEVVRRRADWIARTMATVEASRPQERRYQTGETFPYLGKEVLLRVALGMDSTSRVVLREGRLDVTVPIESSDPGGAVERALSEWFRASALDRLSASTQRWSGAMGLKPKRVLVGDQKTLWGSCAADGTIRFNWRAVQVAPELMEYIVVHELAHLKHRSHSPRFWDEVAGHMPDWRDRRKRLRRAGFPLGL